MKLHIGAVGWNANEMIQATTNSDTAQAASTAIEASRYAMDNYIPLIIALVLIGICVVATIVCIVSMIHDKRKFGATLLSSKQVTDAYQQIYDLSRPDAAEKPELAKPFEHVELSKLSMFRLAIMNVSLFVAAVYTIVVPFLMHERQDASTLIHIAGDVGMLVMLPVTIFAIVATIIQTKSNARAMQLIEYAASHGIDNPCGLVPPRRVAGEVFMIIGSLLGFCQPIFAGVALWVNAPVAKPVIYLYPEDETDVTVKLGRAESLTCSYPLYDAKSPWHVTAFPNGTMIDHATARELYCLYYENDAPRRYHMSSAGFCVAREDIPAFLEEKLALMGLTPREAEEFIIYWLPRLQEKKYAYIRFADAETISENMPLSIEPAPDTLIRVMMHYKPLSKPVAVVNQQITPVTREGFVAVEWGGTTVR